MPVLLQLSDFDGWLMGTAGAELLKRPMTICKRGRYRGG